jgi:hypothetical protein
MITSFRFKYDDGGSGSPDRSDCVVRAITIATRKTYSEVLGALRVSGMFKDGLATEQYGPYLKDQGWEFVGRDGRAMRNSFLPLGILIVQGGSHVAAMVDGVIRDTWDCSNMRVKGFWRKA